MPVLRGIHAGLEKRLRTSSPSLDLHLYRRISGEVRGRVREIIFDGLRRMLRSAVETVTLTDCAVADNPLSNIANTRRIHAVVRRGTVTGAAGLEALLRRVRESVTLAKT